MCLDSRVLYANKLSEDIYKLYEKETGDKINPGEDLTKVVKFLGILIEFEKLDMDCVEIYSKIIKTQDTYKIIFDKEYANKLKESGIGNWNLFLGKMLFYIMDQPNDDFEKAKDGTIFYPTEKMMWEYQYILSNSEKENKAKKEELLLKLYKIDSGQARSEITDELSKIDNDLAFLKGSPKRKRYKIIGRKIGKE